MLYMKFRWSLGKRLEVSNNKGRSLLWPNVKKISNFSPEITNFTPICLTLRKKYQLAPPASGRTKQKISDNSLIFLLFYYAVVYLNNWGQPKPDQVKLFT